MSYDRTDEFRQIVAMRTAERQAQQASIAAAAQPVRPHRSRSEFAVAASRIGNDIHSTAEKLSKLTQLAQSKSLLLFADPTEEINELTLIIKQDITGLNGKLAQLKATMQQPARGSLPQKTKHSTSILEQLGLQLHDAMRDFQGVLQTRSENVRLMHERQRRFTAPQTDPSTPGPSGYQSKTAGSTPIFEISSPLGVGGGGAIFEMASPLGAPAGQQSAAGGAASSSDADVVIDMPAAREQLQLTQANGYDHAQTRALAVENVQSTIVELGEIFEQLAVMVAEQGHMLERVDHGVDESLAMTNAGYSELQRYYRKMRSNRGLVLRVFAVLFFFIVLFGTFFA